MRQTKTQVTKNIKVGFVYRFKYTMYRCNRQKPINF